MMWYILFGGMLLLGVLPTNADEKVRRVACNGDGKLDHWESCAAGGRDSFRVARDTDADGKADAVWDKGSSTPRGPR
jgi:hypothetical protein